ncbi:CynX/NimT family MFS transporter [Sphingobium aquiterrae]|uniref:MFS transporter n=1 Tax=Sphingobium aquiterrae TaxID=2038656 RepID=UPI00301A2D14
MSRNWFSIIGLYLIGVLAAAQLAKFSALAPILRQSYGLTLAQVALLISLLEVGGALFGFVSGLGVARIGARRFLLTGLVILAATSAVEGLAAHALPLFLARAAEGIGYVLVVIAAPTLIIAIAHERQRAAALAVWSTFVPVGIALGSALTGLLVGGVGASGTILLWGGVACAALLFAWQLPIGGGGQRAAIRMPLAGAWLATLAFGFYTMFVCALMMLLPSFLVEKTGASVADAGVIAGLVSLAALPATTIAILAMRRGTLEGRALYAVLIACLVVTAALSPLVFARGSVPGAGATVPGLLAFLTVTLSGISSPLVFARLPILAGAASPDDPRIAVATGLLTQFGAGGALIGPPLGGLVVSCWGWTALGGVIALLALLMLATLMLAEWANARSARA